MKFDKYRKTPDKFLQSICGFCGGDIFAKCGGIRIWHWAHKSETSDCTGKEETAWHREWKDEFPELCQEVIVEHNGKKHRADVIFDGIVYEFQSQSMRTEDMLERERFWCQTGRGFAWVIKAPDARLKKRNSNLEPDPWKAYTWENPWSGPEKTRCPIIIDRCDSWLVYCAYIEWDRKELLLRADIRKVAIKGKWVKDDGLIDFHKEILDAAKAYQNEQKNPRLVS